MESLVYTIKGQPVAWARCAPGYNNRFYDTQKHIKNLYRITLEGQHNKRPMYSGPLELFAKFVFPMPKSKKKIWDQLRGSPYLPVPDSSNLLKFLEDAIVGLLIPDDRIITSVHVKKVYGDEPETIFSIIEL